jgi:hypothetical protein
MMFLAGLFIGFMAGLALTGLCRAASQPDPKQEILEGYDSH